MQKSTRSKIDLNSTVRGELIQLIAGSSEEAQNDDLDDLEDGNAQANGTGSQRYYPELKLDEEV